MSVVYKKNGTEIPITSAIMGGGANNNYSTSEQRIGTWIDGKPLYRKCFTFNIVEVTTTGVSLDIHIPNAIYKNVIASCNTHPYENRTFNPLVVLGSNNQLLVRYFQNQGMDNLVLEYTKTTD